MPSPRDLPKPGIEPAYPTMAEGFFHHWATREAPGKAQSLYGCTADRGCPCHRSSWRRFSMVHLSPLRPLRWAIGCILLYLFIFPFIFISWRLITLQYCSGFCHTLTWISHGFTCVPHPDPPFHLPLHPLPLGFPSAPGPRACLMHPTWASNLFHPW